MNIFGRSIEYSLHAFEDSKQIGTIPAQTYAVHIFDEKPTRAIALVGTGSIETLSVVHVTSDSLSFTISAIDDPEPDSPVHQVNYWIAVVFKLEAGEQDQLIIRALPLERVYAKNKTIGVTSAKIEEIFPDIDNYLSTGEVESMIQLAQINILEDLTNKGFKWSEINRPDQLFNALLFKSLEYIHASQIQRSGDRFAVSFDMAAKNYQKIISNLKVAMDEGDGQPVATRQTGGTVWVSR